MLQPSRVPGLTGEGGDPPSHDLPMVPVPPGKSLLRAHFVASCCSFSSAGGLTPEERLLSSSGFRDQEGEEGAAPGGALSPALSPFFALPFLRPSFSPFPPLSSVPWLEASIVPAWLPLSPPSLLVPSPQPAHQQAPGPGALAPGRRGAVCVGGDHWSPTLRSRSITLLF